MTALTLRTGLALPAALSVRRGLSPQPGGGGPAPYHADAVHFDGATWLTIASLTSTDNHFFGVQFWYDFSIRNGAAIYTADPAGDFGTFGNFPFDATHPMVASVSDAGASSSFNVQDNVDGGTDNAWHSIIIAIDTAGPVGKIYIDRVDVTGTTSPSGTFPFNVATNGRSFVIASDTFGDNYTGDMANLRIAPGQNWLTAGDIAPATLDLFCTADNKPVDPAVATASLGVPAMLLTGNASGFGTNQGTGGAFTTTGALTNASTSPSD